MHVPHGSPLASTGRGFRPWWPEIILVVFVGVFCALAWSSVQHINTLWDELNDHQVAVSLMERPLVGSGLDGTQARLPMYITAGIYAIAGPSISVARAVSIAMGAAALVLTFIAGRRWFGTGPALLSAGLLSVAPYFLTFARTGLTEGDAFYPAAVLVMLLVFDRYLQRRDSIWLALFGMTVGLVLAVKFYGLFFLPALMLCDLLDARRKAEQRRSQPAPPIHIAEAEGITGREMLVWACAAAGLELLALFFAQIALHRIATVFWAGGLLLLLALLADELLTGPSTRKTARRLMRWNTPGGWLVILPIAFAVCLAVAPAHALNPHVARALILSIVRPVEPEVMMRFVDPARLYLGILLLKLGPILGLLTIGALGLAAWKRDHPGLTLISTTAVVYLLFLLILPLRQSFYLMGIYPLVIMSLAWFVFHVARRLADRERLASAWIAVVATACLYLLWGVVQSYPQFGYYGYTLVGNRWLGGESRGYRNLIQVTNDGTEDALEWLIANVPAGRRVVSYLWDDHVIDRYLQGRTVHFHLVRRNAHEAREAPPEVADADYVVLSLNNLVSYADAPSVERGSGSLCRNGPEGAAHKVSLTPFPPRSELDTLFDSVHAIARGRGSYQISVAEILVRQDSVGATMTR